MSLPKSVQLTLSNGLKINALENDYITGEIEKNGIYEKTLCLFIEAILGDDKAYSCVDIGANVGVVTLTMASKAKQVFAFEPIPYLFELIRKSLADNNLENCELINAGLSDQSGSAELYVQQDGNIGASSLSPSDENTSAEPINIRLEKGDENPALQALNKIDLIKIDVEGHETQALLGLGETIQRHQPVVIMEWNSDLTRQGFENHDLMNTVFSGYRRVDLVSNYRIFKNNLDQERPSKLKKVLKVITYEITTPKHDRDAPALLDQFVAENDYQSLVLIPKEKPAILKTFDIHQGI